MHSLLARHATDATPQKSAAPPATHTVCAESTTRPSPIPTRTMDHRVDAFLRDQQQRGRQRVAHTLQGRFAVPHSKDRLCAFAAVTAGSWAAQTIYDAVSWRTERQTRAANASAALANKHDHRLRWLSHAASAPRPIAQKSMWTPVGAAWVAALDDGAVATALVTATVCGVAVGATTYALTSSVLLWPSPQQCHSLLCLLDHSLQALALEQSIAARLGASPPL